MKIQLVEPGRGSEAFHLHSLQLGKAKQGNWKFALNCCVFHYPVS